MTTTINTGNALGAKVLKFLPMNGSEGEVVSGTALTLGAGGSYVNDATYGMTLRGNGTQACASVPLNLSTVNQITLAFRMKWDAYGSGDNMAMEFTPDLNSNAGFYVDPNAGTAFAVGPSSGVARMFPRPTAAAYHYYIITMDRINSLVTVNIDGANQTQTGSVGQQAFGNFASDVLYLFSRGGNSLFGAGNIQKLAIFSGILSDAEKASLYADPDQITAIVADSAPAVAAPAIVGTPQVGVAASYTPGTVTGSPAPAVTQQWTLDGVDISGATGATYTPVTGDATHALRVRQIVTNNSGTANSTSASATVSAEPVSSGPALAGYIVKTYGAGKDFTTAAALATYVNGLDAVAPGKPVMVYCYDNLDLTGQYNFGPSQSNDTMYVTVRPAPGLSFDDLEPDNAPSTLGTVGLILAGNNAVVRVGVIFEAWRVNNASGTMTFRRDGWGQGGSILGFRKSRLNITTPDKPFIFGEYGCQPVLDDCLVVHDNATYNGPLASTTGGGRARRSTFARPNNAGNTNPLWVGFGGASFNEISDCLFSKMGGSPNWGCAGSNNYSDQPLTNAVNITYVSSAFFTSASDYRPAAGSPMIGGASASAVSTNDNHGNNRGPAPDAGATQLVPFLPLIVASVSSMTQDGESIVVTGTYTGTPTSAVGSLNPTATPNGAQSQGPNALTLNSGVWSITFDGVASGNYSPVFTFTNPGGITQASGTAPLEIMGVESAAQDSVNAGPATTFTWQPPTTGIAGVPSDPFPVGVDGLLSTTYRFTPSDNGAGGSFAPSFLDLSASTPSGFMRYTRPTTGASTLTATNTSGGALLNPAAVTYTAVDAPAPVGPSINIATPDANIMAGKRATISGAVSLLGDTSGHVDVFLDPRPSGTPVSLGAANVTSGTWTKQADIPPGLYRLRVVATANNQTTSASTGDIRVLGLTGNFSLPTA